MPGVSDHLAQAKHNEQLFNALDRERYSDWAVTILFYAALHYVDAYLASQGILDPGGHPFREEFMRDYPDISGLRREYLRLKGFAETARYYTGRFTRSDIEGLRRGSYEPLKNHIEALLRVGPSFPSAPAPPSSR